MASHRLIDLKETVRACAASMDDSFGDSLVIEVCNLLAENKVFKQRWPSWTGLQSILIVVYRGPLVSGQRIAQPTFRVTLQIFYFVSFAGPGGSLDLRYFVVDALLHFDPPSSCL